MNLSQITPKDKQKLRAFYKTINRSKFSDLKRHLRKEFPFLGEHEEETRKKISRKARIRLAIPSNNANWRGGITSENQRIRHSRKYKSWRNAVFERDNYTCRGCGVRGGYLEAHHIKSFAEHKDLRFIVDNGITYCKRCHSENDKYCGGK